MLWLASDQVRVLARDRDEDRLRQWGIVNELRANMVRVRTDFTATPGKAKIADAEAARVHMILVIGLRDVEAGNVAVRLHG